MIWGHAGPAVLNPLQTLMYRAIRIMTYAPFGNVDLNPVYKELKLLQVSKVCSLETLDLRGIPIYYLPKLVGILKILLPKKSPILAMHHPGSSQKKSLGKIRTIQKCLNLELPTI